MPVCCECCVLSGRCLCDELITLPEKSYRLLCVVECDLETSWMRRPWPNGGEGGGCFAKNKQKPVSQVWSVFAFTYLITWFHVEQHTNKFISQSLQTTIKWNFTVQSGDTMHRTLYASYGQRTAGCGSTRRLYLTYITPSNLHNVLDLHTIVWFT